MLKRKKAMYVENRATKAERVKLVSKKEHSEGMSNESISLVLLYIGMFRANVIHLKGSCEGFQSRFSGIRVGGHFKVNRQL